MDPNQTGTNTDEDGNPASYLFDEVLEGDVEVVLVLARGQVERPTHPQRHSLAPKQLLGVDLMMIQKHNVIQTSR